MTRFVTEKNGETSLNNFKALIVINTSPQKLQTEIHM